MSFLFPFLLVLLAASLPSPTDAVADIVVEKFVVTNATMAQLLASLASPRREVIFTTTWGLEPEHLKMIRTYLFWLNEQDVLRHTFMLTTDVDTFGVLHDMGAPIFLDRATPVEPYGDAMECCGIRNK
jgi:hypothetical protein